jgi:predicted transcriptional regulator
MECFPQALCFPYTMSCQLLNTPSRLVHFTEGETEAQRLKKHDKINQKVDVWPYLQFHLSPKLRLLASILDSLIHSATR